MIIFVKDSDNSFNYSDIKKKVDPDCRVYAPNEKTAEELLSEEVNLVVLKHKDAIEQCRQLKKISCHYYFRILVVLEPEHAREAIKARMAGADAAIVDCDDPQFLRHAIANEHVAVRRQKEATQQVLENIIVNNRYEIRKLLGIGLRSTSFLVFDTITKKFATLKLLRRMLLNNPVAIERFLDTANKISQIHSPFLVKIVEIGSYQSVPFVVFDIGEAENLYDLMKKGAINEGELEKIGIAAVRALLALKKGRIFHFDIKPENILFTDGSYHLSDFGFIQQLSAPLDNSMFPFWGSADYFSPEFFQPSGVLTARCDVYSLGMVLYTGLMAENPFSGRYYKFIPQLQSEKNILAVSSDKKLSSAFAVTLEAMTMWRMEARPRLRDLEIIFSQAILLKRQNSNAPALNPDGTSSAKIEKVESEKSGTATTGLHLNKVSEDTASMSKNNIKISPYESLNTDYIKIIKKDVIPANGADSSSDSQVIDKIQHNFDREAFKKIFMPSEIRKYINGHQIQVVLFLLAAAIILSIGYLWGSKDRKPIYYQQGKKQLFTCYKGHTQAIRTLDFRTVRCSTCQEFTSLSYVCNSCRKVFGLSLWPLRDMSEEECAAFELKQGICPFCKSKNIRQNLSSK